MPSPVKISIVAGGTGGHVFPAICLGEELEKGKISFDCLTDSRGEKYWPSHWTAQVIDGGNIRSRSISAVVQCLRCLWNGFVQARTHYLNTRPKIVVGFGAYPSLMPLLAARSLGIAIAIFELDTRVGGANQILSWFTPHRFSAEELPNKGFKTLGLPIRQSIENVGAEPYTAPSSAQDFVITVMGGSQGSRIFATVIPDALQKLNEQDHKRITIIHQCPAAEIAKLKDFYAQIGVRASVTDFIEDVANTLKKSHLIISRAGASTLGEIIATTRPAILIPYPHAANNHQLTNARKLERVTAAIVIEESHLNATILADKINNFLQNTSIMLQYSNNLKSLRQPGASSRLASELKNIIRGL